MPFIIKARERIFVNFGNIKQILREFPDGPVVRT